jgi:hypothetical protein
LLLLQQNPKQQSYPFCGFFFLARLSIAMISKGKSGYISGNSIDDLQVAI